MDSDIIQVPLVPSQTHRVTLNSRGSFTLGYDQAQTVYDIKHIIVYDSSYANEDSCK